MPYSSGGRPATAFSPTLGICWPSNTQTLVPSSLVTSRGARSFHFAGEVALPHVGRLADVVVDAHQDHVVHLHGQSSSDVQRRGSPSTRCAMMLRWISEVPAEIVAR